MGSYHSAEALTPETVHPGVQLAARVFREYDAEIQAFIAFHARRPEDAEELYQELFLSLVNARMPEKVHNMKRYLYRAIANDAATRARSKQRYQRRLRVYAEARRHQRRQVDPEAVVLRAEQTRRVFALIERHLPPQQARALDFRFRGDRDTREVAVRMGVNRSSAKRYVSAGLKTLREMGLLREGNAI